MTHRRGANPIHWSVVAALDLLRICWPLGLLLLAVANHAAEVAPANLLANGGFEAGDRGWTADDELKLFGVFRVETDILGRGRVACVQNRSHTDLVAVLQTIPVVPGKVLRLSGLSRSTKLEQVAGVAFHALDARGGLLDRFWCHQVPEWGVSGWQEFTGEYRPPAEAKAIEVRLSVFRAGKVWFDDLNLAAVDPPQPSDGWGEPLGDAGWAVTRFDTPRPVYRLQVADLDGDAAPEFIVGDIDGRLRCQEADGRVLWDRDLGGLALAVATGDLCEDSAPELVVCSADPLGQVRILAASGDLLNSHFLPGVVFRHLALGDLNGDGWDEILAVHDHELVALPARGPPLWQQSFGGPRLRQVVASDVTSDGRPEAILSVRAARLFAAALSSDGKRLWQFEPDGGSDLSGEDVAVADLDSDGLSEVLMGCREGRVVCLRAGGQQKWVCSRPRNKLWPTHRDLTGNLGAMPVQIAVCDFCPERPGLEILAALPDCLWLIDPNGKLIWEGTSGLLLLDLIPDGNGGVYIPSSGFRDASIYHLRLVRGRGNPLALESVRNPIYESLDLLSRDLRSGPALPAPPAGPLPQFHVILASLPWPFSPYGSLDLLRQADRFLKTKESAELEFLFMLWPKDLPAELERGQMQEPGQILEVVRFLEQLGRPFLFFIAHGATPNLSLDTIEKTLALAPKTCRGFYVAENTSRYPTAKWDEFVDWAEKVLDLCLRYGGKNLIFKEMYDSWALLPSDPAVRDRLLHPRYRGSVVALYATNDAHAPELQFGGMVGLKQTGLVSDWGVSTQDWNWSWSEQGLAQAYSCLCPADVVLRLELQAACLGARWFHIEGGQEYLRRGAAELALPAFRHRDLFHELIRKRFLPPVADVDNLSFSNLIAVRSPTPGLAAARLNGTCLGSPHERPFESWQQGLFGVRDALVSTVPGYFPAYAYGARRYCDSMFPATPYGFVRMVPDCPEAESLLTGRYVLRTDGIAELIHGARIGADAARSRLQHDLERGLDGQWFLAAGVGVYAHRVGNAYRVWLMDPGYLCPEGVRTVLQVRLPEPSLSVRDLISGQPITGVTRRLPMDVPAGGFRLLEVVPGARP